MIRNIFLLVLSALAAWSCTATDDEIAQGPAADTRPAGAQRSLSITIAPKPAFTEVGGENSPTTRAVQTEQGTQWEQGDVVWLDGVIQDSYDNQYSFRSALKYTGTVWRHLTEAEATEMGLNNDNRFNRTLILSDGYAVVTISGYYAGNGKPENGLITIPAPGSDAAVPVMWAAGKLSAQDGSWSLTFTYRCSRLRIPAGYGLQMTNYGYCASYRLFSGYFEQTYATDLQLPAADKDRDVFLLPVADDNGTPVLAPVTLTRNGSAVWTFTPEPAGSVSGYYGRSYTLPEVGSGGVTPGDL